MGYAGLDLSGRLAVIIGGTSGIGRAIARGLAQAGASVVATGRRGALVESIAGEIEELGRRTLRQTADVTDPASLDALLAACERLAPVDILVNSAGITARAPTVSVSDADWERILETNLTGTLRACRVFGSAMLRRGYGRIINVASLTASVGFYEVAAYAASKAGVAALTRSLAVEWGSSGVCVNALVPGVFRTPLNEGLLDGTARGRELLLRTPMHRFGHPDELVGAAIFLASESASFVTGHLLAVDGGFLASGVNQ
jgi:NAD(P)-dependent dehydrogenase (short-subunit alcohol dehydrogenase family)